MDMIMFDAGSSAAADEITAAVEARELWGVSMGTTSKASKYSSFVLIEATFNRVNDLLAAKPNEIEFEMQYHDICSFTEASSEEKFWYLRGKL
tara:strand:- start:1394 stop:1672 length:279 start_codon:yes stop_codon:yes gene_type:complete